jgi:hypothetical protein
LRETLIFCGEGEIRTHESREALPVFKSHDLHGSGTQSHANAMIPNVVIEA